MDIGGPRQLDGDDPTFRRLGLTGIGLGAAVSLASAHSLGLDLGAQSALAAASFLTFLALAIATSRLMGRESLTYYHHEIAVLAVAAALTAAAGGPVLAHLDATALGLGTFLAVGRLGCWRAGCCHGRVARCGYRYGWRQRAPALPPYLRERPLIPVQLVEAGAAALLTTAGAVVLDAHRPGLAFATYVTGYALLRPVLEELRGDWRRPRWRGFSEAQWTSFAIVAATGIAAHADWISIELWGAAPAALAAELAAILVWQHRRRPHLLDPDHVAEIARGCDRNADGEVSVHVTSQAIKLSGGRSARTDHISLSRDHPPLEDWEARTIAEVVAWEALGREGVEVAVGPTGVVHVVARNLHEPELLD